jgi:SAM-dependent methyltransferase
MIRETDDTDECLTGRRLYGDDFGIAEIENWYKDEENAYFEQVTANRRESPNTDYPYEYAAFNRLHGYRSLAKRHFGTCLVLGCASGQDVRPLAGQVDKFVALEPAEKWWRSEIGGTAAEYIKPAITGDIPLPDGCVELAIALGVLHHIPNVSHVVGDLARVLKPGGIFIVREPIISMGDWRRPRPGLTKHERGIPPKLLQSILTTHGFHITRAIPVMMPIVPQFARLLGIRYPYNSQWVVRLDAALARLSWRNFSYYRVGLVRKFAPTSMFITATRF